MTQLTNKQLKIILMGEQMREDRRKSLAIHQEKFGDRVDNTEKSSSIFDNTLRPLPVNLYLDCKEYERGEYKYEPPEEHMDYLFMASFSYHALTLALPLWLFIMLYW